MLSFLNMEMGHLLYHIAHEMFNEETSFRDVRGMNCQKRQVDEKYMPGRGILPCMK